MLAIDNGDYFGLAIAQQGRAGFAERTEKAVV
jgi:hypothetical protein